MNRLRLAIEEQDHVWGKANAPVTLLEYGDYECPYCGQAYYVVKKIQLEFGEDRLRFVFRNFPLSQIHPHALNAACIAEAAGLQNKFWEMHDELYEHQYALEDEDFKKYAEKLNLNVKKLFKDMGNEEIRNRIQKDLMSGVRSDINGTPTFFINGIRYDGLNKYGELMPAIEAKYLKMVGGKYL